jgi:hypothetical protein
LKVPERKRAQRNISILGYPDSTKLLNETIKRIERT